MCRDLEQEAGAPLRRSKFQAKEQPDVVHVESVGEPETPYRSKESLCERVLLRLDKKTSLTFLALPPKCVLGKTSILSNASEPPAPRPTKIKSIKKALRAVGPPPARAHELPKRQLLTRPVGPPDPTCTKPRVSFAALPRARDGQAAVVCGVAARAAMIRGDSISPPLQSPPLQPPQVSQPVQAGQPTHRQSRHSRAAPSPPTSSAPPRLFTSGPASPPPAVDQMSGGRRPSSSDSDTSDDSTVISVNSSVLSAATSMTTVPDTDSLKGSVSSSSDWATDSDRTCR